jgi:hypothetical protein
VGGGVGGGGGGGGGGSRVCVKGKGRLLYCSILAFIIVGELHLHTMR